MCDAVSLRRNFCKKTTTGLDDDWKKFFSVTILIMTCEQLWAFFFLQANMAEGADFWGSFSLSYHSSSRLLMGEIAGDKIFLPRCRRKMDIGYFDQWVSARINNVQANQDAFNFRYWINR